MVEFKVTVEAERRVACPAYGTAAYQSDYLRKDFDFGKGTACPTGAAARLAAKEYATTLLDKANYVSLVHWKGGTGRYEALKEDRNARFATGWDQTGEAQ